ncbi:MAG: ABC transporter substrate-binding protein [Candidatus Methanomethylophilaceae archaeon]
MNSKIAALIMVAIVVIAGTAVYYVYSDDQKDSDTIEGNVTITDSLGNEITIEAPVNKICVTSSNAAEFLQILGVADRVTCIDTDTKELLANIYGDARDIGKYNNPNGEIMLSENTKILISQSSSRSLSTAAEEALESNYGITVIRLDCYGETMLRDIEQLALLLGSKSVNDALEGYMDQYESITEHVLSKVTPSESNFLFAFTSMKKYYNQNSELSKIVESLGVTNYTRELSSVGSGVSTDIDSETIWDADQSGGISYLFIRGLSNSTGQTSYQSFLDNFEGSYDFRDLNVSDSGNTYVLETDIMSGPRDFVGYVVLAEVLGIDTGLEESALELANEFNEKYGFSEEYSWLAYQV